jgi:methylmalonyl-CoA/ethylmalonyl-CoA epimerase
LHIDVGNLSQTLQEAVGGGVRVDQVAFIVENLDQAMGRWSAFYPGEEWTIYTYGPDNVVDLRYLGQPGRYSMRLAFIGRDPQIELVEPLDGPSIYHDWIAAHGFGMHHLGFYVARIADAIGAFERAGRPTLQSGRGYGLDGDGGFAYFDFEDIFAIHLEAIEVPKRRRPSETRTDH